MSNPDYKSSTLLNAILDDASQVYQDRIPEATQDNLAKVGTSILNYSQTRNEFVSALVNRIGKVIITSKLYENPLSEFKKGMLDYGKDIEEVFVDLIQANVFDPATAESELYKRNLPDVKAVFHRLNRKDFYKTTIENEILRQAFTGEQAMMSLVDKITQKLYTSDNFDEFEIMKNLIFSYGVEGKFAMEPVAAVTDEASAKSALVTIKKVSNNLTFMKSDYNFANVKTHTLKEDQIVLINTDFDAIIDVEVLASAFNMSKVEFIGRRVLVDDFGGLDNVLCAVVDRHWFMIYDNLIRTEEKYNEQGLYYNYWLHHWQVISASPFANAVLFVTVDPTLASIDINPPTATVATGSSIQFVVEATGTNNPPSKATFTTDATGEYTYISSTGLLVIDPNETTSPITVTATSTFDTGITDTAVVTLA